MGWMTDMPLSARRWRIRAGWLLMFVLASIGLPAWAQAAADEPSSWLCWMTTKAPPEIRCTLEIADQPALLTPSDDEAGELLEMLQTRFHEGASAQELERLFRLYGLPVLANQVLTIPLFTVPFEESWREQRPQQLLRAVLCDKTRPCNVVLRRPQ